MKKHSLRKWLNRLPIIISALALIVSVVSLVYARRDSIYTEHKDSMIITPAIAEYLDGDEIVFTLNNENSRLQALRIIFPKAVSDEELVMNTIPVSLYKRRIEFIAENYFDKQIPARDSAVTVGTGIIPVILDYEAVVYGFPQCLRENRNLIFFISKDQEISASFTNTALIQRCGYPIKCQIYWWFSKTDEKVVNQDRKDIEILLDKQLKNMYDGHVDRR